jgi:hypothetical protein
VTLGRTIRLFLAMPIGRRLDEPDTIPEATYNYVFTMDPT